MNSFIGQLLQQCMMGKMQNHPAMSMFNQMMQGKNPQEQFQTLLNAAKSQGKDINAKMFSEQDLREMGILK